MAWRKICPYFLFYFIFFFGTFDIYNVAFSSLAIVTLASLQARHKSYICRCRTWISCWVHLVWSFTIYCCKGGKVGQVMPPGQLHEYLVLIWDVDADSNNIELANEFKENCYKKNCLSVALFLCFAIWIPLLVHTAWIWNLLTFCLLLKLWA